MSTIQTTFACICCIDHRNHRNSMLNHHRVGAKAKKMKKRRKVCSRRDDDEFGEGKNIDMMEETKTEAATMMTVAMMMTTTMTRVNDHKPYFVAFAETKILPVPETRVPVTAT